MQDMPPCQLSIADSPEAYSLRVLLFPPNSADCRRPTAPDCNSLVKYLHFITLWEYSPRLCSMTYTIEKRHSRSAPFPENHLIIMLSPQASAVGQLDLSASPGYNAGNLWESRPMRCQHTRRIKKGERVKEEGVPNAGRKGCSRHSYHGTQ